TTFELYGFQFADGMAARLAADIVNYCCNRQDSVLPLAQVMCTQLYDLVTTRPAEQCVIQQADIAGLGGVRGGMKRHVDHLLDQHLPLVRKGIPRLLGQLFSQTGVDYLSKGDDRSAFQRLLSHLYHTQPDGTLTTALMPETPTPGQRGSVEEHWSGKMPME